MDLVEQVQDHEKRIGVLEVNDAADKVKFESLCARLDDLITLLKWCVGTAIGLGAILATVAAAYIQAGGIIWTLTT